MDARPGRLAVSSPLPSPQELMPARSQPADQPDHCQQSPRIRMNTFGARGEWSRFGGSEGSHECRWLAGNAAHQRNHGRFLHARTRLPRPEERIGRPGAGRDDRAPDRRAGPDHDDQHLRQRPAHVRGSHRRGSRARSSGTRTWARSSRSATASTGSRSGDRVVLPFNIGCGFCKNCEVGPDRILPDRQPRQRRRGLRLRRHGPVQRRPGRAAAGALRRLERPGPARRTPGRRRTTTSCSPTSCRPGITAPSWRRSASGTRW